MKKLLLAILGLVQVLNTTAQVMPPKTTAATRQFLTNETVSGMNTTLGGVGGTNPLAQTAFAFSQNTHLLPHFERALTEGRKPHVLWLGDSIGDNSVLAMESLFRTSYKYGVGKMGGFYSAPEFIQNYGFPWLVQHSQDYLSSSLTATAGEWWSSVYFLATGNSQIWGYDDANLFGPCYQMANKVAFYYSAKSTRGTCTVDISRDNANWTTVMTVDTTTGTAGIRCTNAFFKRNPVLCRITTTVGGTDGQVVYLTPVLEDTTSLEAVFFRANASGKSMADFCSIGTNSISSLFTNFNPDIVFYETTQGGQSGAVALYDQWTNISYLIKTYASNADAVLIEGQDFPTSRQTDPTQGGPFQLSVYREEARTNSDSFIDMFTPHSLPFGWTNIVIANHLNVDFTTPHLNPTGQLYAGEQIIRQLGLPSLFSATGTLRTNTVTPYSDLPQNIPGLALRFDGDATISPALIGCPRLPDQSTNGWDGSNASTVITIRWDNTIGQHHYIAMNGSANSWLTNSFGGVGANVLAQPNDIFAVVRCHVSGYLYDSFNPDGVNRCALRLGNGAGIFYAGNTNVIFSSINDIWMIVEAYYSGANSYLLTNGVVVTNSVNPGTGGLDGNTFGARYPQVVDPSNPMNGDCAQFLVYNRQLAPNERFLLMSWLSQRYGILIPVSQGQTNRPFQITTNWTTGLVYSNDCGQPIIVKSDVILTEATATAGRAEVQFWSNARTNRIGRQTIAGNTNSAPTNTFSIQGFVPPNSTFTFTNMSVGAGNSGTLIGGELIIP